MKNLSALATSSGHFTIAAFDHRNSLFSLLNASDPEAVTADQVVALKRLFIKHFAPISSAILIDPVYGLDYGLDLDREVTAGTGILMSLEASSYDESAIGRVTRLLPHWGVKDVKAHGASAKLLLYYHPQAPIASTQLKLVQDVSKECQSENIIFLIEPILYAVGEYSNRSQLDVTLKTIDQLNSLVDILKLEFPLNVNHTTEHEWQQAAKDISRHATVPWILLSRGMGFDHFKRLTRICCEQGASGIAVGRAVWQEIGDIAKQTPDPETKILKIDKFLHTTGRSRMIELSKIVEAKAKRWNQNRP
jgi:tagatose-1,6-bisphosphate aldolase